MQAKPAAWATSLSLQRCLSPLYHAGAELCPNLQLPQMVIHCAPIRKGCESLVSLGSLWYHDVL